MMQENTDIHLYWDVIRRRKYHIIIPFALVFCLSVVIAFVLPPVYRSEATILIEAQEIPQDFVRTTVTGYVEERLQMINQIVLSRTKLMEIITRFGLYEDMRGRYTTEEIIERMRKAVQMEPIQTDVANPRSGRPGSATIAFMLSYEGKEPGQVVQVANVLASLYLEENLKNRKEKARTTFEFLETQLAELRSEILSTEGKIAEFKNKHMSELPELMELNLQTMDRMQREIHAKEEQIKTLVNRKIYLEGQLAGLEPVRYTVSLDGKRVMTPKEELEALRSQYVSLRATLTDDHPDVVSMGKRLDAMETDVATREDLRERYRKLRNKKAELAALLERFSRRHPDVIKLEKEISKLRADVEAFSEKQSVPNAGEQRPENPSYINLQTQITSTRMEIDNTRNELKLTKGQFQVYQRRVENTPKVEQLYRALQRDYTGAQARYRETTNRLMAAKEAKGLEESRMAEKFTLIDPPVTPEKPDRPNRLAIILIGLVLATGAGIGFASMAEYMDQSVRTAQELAEISALPVLAVIPYLETPQDRTRKLWKRCAFACSTVGIMFAALAALHYLYKPLDILWIKVMQKFHIGWF